MEDLRHELRRWLGFEDFRPHQEAIIQRVLAGQSLLVVMPTGSGKSLCYQLPAFLLPGLTLVVSPLIALMKDQVDFLNDRVPGSATFINSTLPLEEQQARWRMVQGGKVKLLYLSPERLRSERLLEGLRRLPIDRLVVDEAHCISEWGHDFRPDYLRLREVHRRLGGPPVLALTATATPEVQEDIPQQLGLPQMERFVAGFNRPNLSFEVRSTPGQRLKMRALQRFLQGMSGSGIVYVPTRREADLLEDFLSSVMGRRAAAYHAGLPPKRRAEVQEAFMANALDVVAATGAFGMGVDKPNLRFIVHMALPSSLETYYQQAGRAGRDGHFARCLLLYDPEDRFLHEQFIASDVPTLEELRRLLQTLQQQAQGRRMVVSSEDLEYQTGLPEVKLRIGLHHLETLGLLVYVGDRPEGMELHLRATELTAQAVQEREESARRRQESRRRRLEAIVRYAETEGCRRRFLLGYFSDPAEPTYDVFCCDNCTFPYEVTEGADPEALSHRAPVRILHLLQREPLSRSALLQQVATSQPSDLGPESLPRSFWSEVVDQLLLAGLLQAQGTKPTRLALSPAGRRVIQERWSLRIPLPPTRLEDLDEAGQRLYYRLEALRHELAEAEKVPPHRIWPTQTTLELAARRPRGPEELEAILGLGPVRAQRYGERILTLLRAESPPSEASQENLEAFLSGTRPVPLYGNWEEGYALGFSGTFVGQQWERTELGQWIYRLKYRGERAFALRIAERMASFLEARPDWLRCDFIVPIPPSRTDRAFDPLTAIVVALSRLTGLPVNFGALVRVRATPPQKDMVTEAQKELNVRGVFRVPFPEQVHQRRILLVDDFYDSGATLREAARTLRQAGVALIRVLAAAKTIHH